MLSLKRKPNAREPKASSVTTWRDRVGREGGSGGREHMFAFGQFMLMYGKKHHIFVIILQLK